MNLVEIYWLLISGCLNSSMLMRLIMVARFSALTREPDFWLVGEFDTTCSGLL